MSIADPKSIFNPLQPEPVLLDTAEDPTPAIFMNIVAIGASAGGLEALQRWFDNIPDDTNAAPRIQRCRLYQLS